jgi:two-component system, chemotaxis family, chemotaxis protein CheY
MSLALATEHKDLIYLVHLADMLSLSQGIGTGIYGLQFNVFPESVKAVGLKKNILSIRPPGHWIKCGNWKRFWPDNNNTKEFIDMGYNVLIVDDSPIIRKMVAKTLKISDLNISEYFFAENGREALRVLDENWIDIVFADINMPEMNGMEMIQEMVKKDLLSAIPVVIISTERSRERIEALKAMGISAYLHKPFMPEDVAGVVRGLLH